jgi:hypothetical protein
MNTHDELGEKAYYESLTLEQRRSYDRQEIFLRAYMQLGKLSRAAEVTEIPVNTVESWQRRDTHGFNKRLQQAHQQYVENLEQLMDERLYNPTSNRGSDVLLMFKLKAEAPEKYREEVKVVGIEASKQMMDRLRELAMKDRAAQETPAVEGNFQELPELPPPMPPSAEPAMRPTPDSSPPSATRPTPKARLMAQRRGRVVRR